MSMDKARMRRLMAENLVENEFPLQIVESDTFCEEINRVSEENRVFMQSSSSSYTIADEGSEFGHDIDRWMASDLPTENTAVQGSRISTTQRSVLARTSSLDTAGMWYILAMLMPIFSVAPCNQWRCSPSALVSTAGFCLNRFSHICGRIRSHLRQLAQDQMARELFATAMDIVLVIYAIGFLVLSLYQATAFA